jgi:ABC-type sugar transport system permease subunit
MNQPNKTLSPNIFPLLIVISSVICFIVASFLLYFSFYAQTAEERAKYALALALSGVVITLIFYFLLLYTLNYIRIRKILGGDYFGRWEYPKDSGKGDVYFCSEGVYDSDHPYKSLDTFGSRFLGAEIPSDNRSVMRFANIQYTGSRFQTTKRTQEVLIPPGKEEDAEKMVMRFGEYLGRRSKFSKDQWRYILPQIAVILVWFFVCFEFVAMPAIQEAKIERNQQAAEHRQESKIKELTPLWNKIRQTLEPQFEKLKALPDGKLTAKEAGFDENSEVLTVLYGHCAAKNEFYVSVVLKKIPVKSSANFANETGAFNYTTTTPPPAQPSENFCKPSIQDYFENRIFLPGGWIYGEVILRPYLPTGSPSGK